MTAPEMAAEVTALITSHVGEAALRAYQTVVPKALDHAFDQGWDEKTCDAFMAGVCKLLATKLDGAASEYRALYFKRLMKEAENAPA